MNKLFSKVVGVSLGLAMALGVGVAVGTKSGDVKAAYAAETITGTVEPGNGGKFAEAGWSSSGLGSKYSDGSAKFDSSGDNIYKTDLFSESVSSGMTSLVVTISYKINGTGASANAVTITPYCNGSYSSGVTETGFSSTSQTSKSVTVSSGLTNCTGFKLAYTKSSGNLGVYSISWTATYTVITKTLDSISLDISAVKKTFTTGDSFDSTGLVVTAHYTVPATYPDAVVTPTSITSPDMSTAGTKDVTVSYTEGGVTKTASYQITVNDPRTVSSLLVLDSDAEELSDGDEVELTASLGATSVSTDITCEVTYSPTGSDGNVTITSATGVGFVVTTEDNEVYTLTFTANGNHEITIAATEDDSVSITVTYIIAGLPNITYVTDTLTNANTINSTANSYSDWSNIDKQKDGIDSDAVYAGNSAGGNISIQLRSSNNNSGVITTSSGGTISSITVVFNSNTAATRQINILAKNTAYSEASDLYGNNAGTTVFTSEEVDADKTNLTQSFDFTELEDSYTYFGIKSVSSALYIESIEVEWAVEQEIVDTLEYIYIDGSLTTSSYFEGQTISLDGLTVYGHYTTAGDVSLAGKSGLILTSTPATATSTSLDEITVNASFEGKNASETYEITVNPDSVTKLSWGNRGTVNVFSGTTLGDAVDTSAWTFTPTWASGKSDSPSWGTGENDVHVGLYDTPTPASEGTALTTSYALQASDNGKYLVAYYQGTKTGNNTTISVTKWRSVKEDAEISSEITWSSSTATISDTSLVTEVQNGGYTNYELSSLRLGTGNGGGSITITASSDITSVKVSAKAYSDSYKGTLTIGDKTADIQSTTYTDYEVTLATPTASISLSTASKNVRINMAKITVYSSASDVEIGKTDDCLGLETFIDSYMHTDIAFNDDPTLDVNNTGDCKTKGWYSDAKAAFNNLNDHQRSLFVSNSAYLNEFARLSAWAAANGDAIGTDTNDNQNVLVANSSNLIGLISSEENSSIPTIIVIVSLVGLTAVGGYFLLRKKKEQ